jgi:hypothetical protein
MKFFEADEVKTTAFSFLAKKLGAVTHSLENTDLK